MSEHATGIPAPRRLDRHSSDRTLAGVCGGLGRYFEIHPAVFRVAFVVLTLLGGAGILIYLAAALVMPDEGEPDSIVTAAMRRRRDRPWIAIVLGLVGAAGAALLATVSLWPRDDAWAFLLPAGAVILGIMRFGVAGRSATAARGTRRRRRVLRLLAVALASSMALLLVLGAVFTAVFDVQLSRGVADRRRVVTSLHDLRSDYRLGVGGLRLDLHSLVLPDGETHVAARVDAGELRLIVPEGVALRARVHARLGELDLLGKTVSGRNVEARLDEHGPRVLVLDLRVGIGSVRIVRGLR